jgi:hypothetical protein
VRLRVFFQVTLIEHLLEKAAGDCLVGFLLGKFLGSGKAEGWT